MAGALYKSHVGLGAQGCWVLGKPFNSGKAAELDHGSMSWLQEHLGKQVLGTVLFYSGRWALRQEAGIPQD